MNAYAKRTAFNLASGKVRYNRYRDARAAFEGLPSHRRHLEEDGNLDIFRGEGSRPTGPLGGVVAVSGRALLTPEEELRIWKKFAQLCAELKPRVNFNKDGVASHGEVTRRIALLCQFDLVEFRSQDQQIKETYQENFGPISLKWVINYCGTRMPAFYYQWTFNAIMEESKRKVGPKTASLLLGSEPHVEFLRAAFGRKIDTYIVKEVITS